MVRFPRQVSDNAFDKLVSRGAVVRTKLVFTDGSEGYERLLIISLDCSNPDVYHLLCTSKIDFYKRNPYAKNFSFFIKLGQSTIFNREAVIDLRRVHELEKEKMMQRYNEGNLHILGQIEEDILNEVDNLLRSSKLIAPKHLKLIVPGYRPAST